MDWLVLGTTMVGLATEQVIAQAHIGGVLQIGDDCLSNSGVDGDVAVPLVLPGIAGLLLEDGEAGLEGQVIVDEVSEAKLPEVTHSESKVDANDEQHIVTIPLVVQ